MLDCQRRQVRISCEVARSAERLKRTLRVTIDSARRQRLLSLRWLQRRTDALETRHGARIVARVRDSGVMRAESEGERVGCGGKGHRA